MRFFDTRLYCVRENPAGVKIFSPAAGFVDPVLVRSVRAGQGFLPTLNNGVLF